MTAVIILLVILFIAALMISSHKKAAEEETNKQNDTAQRIRDLGFPVVEIRTDEVDGEECDVANFAVKGLFYRSPEDQDAATQLSDPERRRDSTPACRAH